MSDLPEWALEKAHELLPKIYAQRVTWRAEELLARALVTTRLAARNALVAEIVGALRDIAKQKLPDEMDPGDLEYADFEGAYIEIVNRARAALNLAEAAITEKADG